MPPAEPTTAKSKTATKTPDQHYIVEVLAVEILDPRIETAQAALKSSTGP